jgi:hypothetical protein
MSRHDVPKGKTLREFIIKILSEYPEYLEDELMITTRVRKDGEVSWIDGEFSGISEAGKGSCTLVLENVQRE